MERVTERTKRIKLITLPRTARTVAEGAFYHATSLCSVVVNEGLEDIGTYAFLGTGLRSVTLPNSLRAIHQGAFGECKKLRRAVLGEGIQTLGVEEYDDDRDQYVGVFQECALEEVRLPTTLKRIEYRAFADCEELRQVRLPDGLTTLERFCFSNTGLEEIALPRAIAKVS